MGLEKYIKRIHTCLRLLGIFMNINKSSKTICEKVMNQWILHIQQSIYYFCLIQQLTSLYSLMTSGDNLLQLTYSIPCFTFSILGVFKIGYFFVNLNYVTATIEILRKLDLQIDYDDVVTKIIFKRLKLVVNLMLCFAFGASSAFVIGPIIMMVWYYYTTGVIKLFLPFILWYPFDAYGITFWPLAYLHQIWISWTSIMSVYGPDCFFFTCCTFIHIHFRYLYRDIEVIVKYDNVQQNIQCSDMLRKDIISLVDRHRELIRIVTLLEKIYSKSTLLNVVTSSLIICITGFNLTAYRNYVLMAPFCSFLMFSLMQTYCYCYYGDDVMSSSMALFDAVYNSQWYDVGIIERKCLLIMLMRSNTPCKFTAYGFMDINIRAFTRILSTSWSYFALLNQIYHQD